MMMDQPHLRKSFHPKIRNPHTNPVPSIERQQNNGSPPRRRDKDLIARHKQPSPGRSNIEETQPSVQKPTSPGFNYSHVKKRDSPTAMVQTYRTTPTPTPHQKQKGKDCLRVTGCRDLLEERDGAR